MKLYKEDKGYGFIKPEGGEDLFFHISSWDTPGIPHRGDLVEFTTAPARKGIQAVGVNRIAALEHKVLVLGEHRVPLNDIRGYGMSRRKVTREIPRSQLSKFDPRWKEAAKNHFDTYSDAYYCDTLYVKTDAGRTFVFDDEGQIKKLLEVLDEAHGVNHTPPGFPNNRARRLNEKQIGRAHV